MSKVLKAAVAAMLACGLMLVAGNGVASAQTATPLTKVVSVTGKARNGKQFTGTYTIDRFINKGGKLFTVGTLKGKVGNKRVTREGVRMPASVPGQTSQAGASQVLPEIPGSCTVLNLVLQPITVNLLGLVVRTNLINVRIDAVPGNGNLLGNLLCGITNILNPGATSLGQLTAILNALLALVPRTG